jgi:hypothetical protein
MEKCCGACGDRKYYFRSTLWVLEGACVPEASIGVDRMSMGHSLADRSSNEADFLCIFVCVSSILHGGYGKEL